MNSLRRSIVAFAVLAVPACGAPEFQSTETPEAGDAGTVVAQRGFNPCLTGSANMTVALGAGMSTVEAASPDTSYAQSACGSFIADILIGDGARNPPQYYIPSFDVGGGDALDNPWLDLSQAQCGVFAQYSYVYRMAAGASSFAYLGGGKSTGVWIPAGLFVAHCEARPVASFQKAPTELPPASGTDTYRVVVSAKVGAIPRKVLAAATHIARF